MSPNRHSPLYEWLAETLRQEISQGIYKPGDALPTEHELMRKYNLSSTTVRRAVHDLVREGWIYRRAGKGTFVKRSKLEERLVRLTSFAEEMRNRNITPHFNLVRAEAVPAPCEVAAALQVPENQPVYLIERVQLANDESIALACGYWQYDAGKRLSELDLDSISLYEALEETFNVLLIEADESISAAVADGRCARALGIPRQSPLLVRRRISYTMEMHPVEYTVTYYRADRYEYKIHLARLGA